MRLVFAGSPAFAVPSLKRLLQGPHRLMGVYTQPDRPAGRGRKLQAGPITQLARASGIEIRQPSTFRDAETRSALAALRPDLMIVVAYGLLLPQKVLDIPPLGCWNVHASLLPRWRGAAPIQRAIEAGDSETGVCLMRMARTLDTGPVLLRQSTAIAPDETADQLQERLAQLGAEVLEDALKLLRAGLLPQAVAQTEAGATYAPKLTKSESLLDWTQPAVVLACKVRALQPWPIAEGAIAGETVRILEARAVGGGFEPGRVVAASRQGIDIATGEGVLRILHLQRAGGKVVHAADYLNARRELRAALE